MLEFLESGRGGRVFEVAHGGIVAGSYHEAMVTGEKWLLAFLLALLAATAALLTLDLDPEVALRGARVICVLLAAFFVSLVLAVRRRLERRHATRRENRG